MEQLQKEIATIISRIQKPKRAMVTAGMPYANGPLHLGHLAGTHIPADIYARWLKMFIGSENVLFVCGTDDHGSTSEIAATKANKTVQEFISEIHSKQHSTLKKYGIDLDVYSGTSREDNFNEHKEYCQDFLRTLHENKMLEKKTSLQWFDTKMNIFLPDRYVTGTCPNEKCTNTNAYSEECDVCGAQYDPKELKQPKSSLSDCEPVLKETDHWWLDMWQVSDELKEWIESKQKTWRKSVYLETIGTVTPSIIFSNTSEDTFKSLKEKLPDHKSRYAPGKKIVVQFSSLKDLENGKSLLKSNGVESDLVDGWAHRSITRDVKWGIPVPTENDSQMAGKTLYVWPESLIAPISFTKVALKNKGMDPQKYKDYWTKPDTRISQFIGQDNIYFYVLMQGALWLGNQADPHRLPKEGELQLTDIISNYHLLIDGQKMSKSSGNFYTGDQLLDEMGFEADQIRYYLSILSLSDKNSNFEFEGFKQRNDFLAGPMNASFEKPLSAAHSKFDGIIPDGNLIGKTEKETIKIIQKYMRFMDRAEFSKILFEIENYARIINGLFAQYKPHDDRHDETQRKDALYSSFFILKNIMIMLYPFVPHTMERLRTSLNLHKDVFDISELGKPIQSGHKLGEQLKYF